ncbi:uncharacterized protein LOC120110251 [Phoenix dactylifera]|uniref:Uncharacterized protein LOC120110251 n=1 Tax=Phoenix dactylifera TaxID=42345 RepID=A0A8B9A211_PHODC|nr:uncharacterized protein LOC120110251 [Phoenix dactylifera]
MAVMARLFVSKKKKMASTILVIYTEMMLMIMSMMAKILETLARVNVRIPREMVYVFDRTLDERVMNRIANLRLMIMESDQICIDQLRMHRRAFWKLCEMLKSISKLEGNRNVQVEEMVAIFLHILGHHSKNRVMQLYFRRSGEIVSRHFNVVLNAILRLHRHLLKNPEPVTERSTDEKWMWFPNCLGALDGTHIRMRVSKKDKPRYRSRKNEISTTVLGVCSQDMQFIYVLPGWEGSAHDNRVLRDAISRRNGLKVSQGNFKSNIAAIFYLHE